MATMLPWWAGAIWLMVALSVSAALKVAWVSAKTFETSRRNQWLAAIGTGALIRALTPFDLVRVFTGWELLGKGFAGAELPRYGAGWVTFLRPLLSLYPDPELWVSWVNLITGTLTIAAISLMTASWRSGPFAAKRLVWSAWLLALMPLLIRHHRSESALPLAFAMWLVGGTLWSQWLRRGDRMLAWLAAPAFAIAAHTRPSFALAAPVTIWALGKWLPREAWQRKWAQGPLVILLWLLLPQILWLTTGGQMRAASGDLPTVASPLFVLQLPVMLVGLNLALWPQAFPVAITAFGLGYAWRGRHDPRVRHCLGFASVLGGALLTLGMTDPVVASLPRLQAPWLALWTCVVVVLHPGQTATGSAFKRGLIILVASYVVTLPWLFRPENADIEDRALSVVAQRLADQRGDLYWLAPGDSGADKVSRAYPTWRFQRPFAQLRLLPLRDLPPPGQTDNPAWVWLGVRCAAKHRAIEDAVPQSYEQPACARVRSRKDLEPVWTQSVANHGNVHFPWWPQSSHLPIGLYRLQTKASPQ
ncbi:MAG: hypothetical protein CMH53_06280 [Myxococcales bacterium]|nr:hypothetical protein [Myxococcales bacterium]